VIALPVRGATLWAVTAGYVYCSMYAAHRRSDLFRMFQRLIGAGFTQLVEDTRMLLWFRRSRFGAAGRCPKYAAAEETDGSRMG
jgi:hypothetical protein